VTFQYNSSFKKLVDHRVTLDGVQKNTVPRIFKSRRGKEGEKERKKREGKGERICVY
jgi:hypothetical protein